MYTAVIVSVSMFIAGWPGDGTLTAGTAPCEAKLQQTQP
jgi:hypothetical protein